MLSHVGKICYVISNGSMTANQLAKIGREVVMVYFKELSSYHLPGGTQFNTVKPQHSL